MTLQEAFRFTATQLCAIYQQRETENITDLVMEHITGLKRMDRSFQKDRVLTPEQQVTLQQYTQQLLQHNPVQYVLHETWFYGMALFVDEEVLIPRPETEELVNWVVQDAKISTKKDKTLTILDIGTGSGCIPIALKKHISPSSVHAIDISEGALAVARKNAAAQQATIIFHQGDILQPVSANLFPMLDIIVSNPPYIPLKDKTNMHRNVLDHEPHIALFVANETPLIFYEVIAALAVQQLLPDGCVYTEIHEDLGEEVKQLFVAKGFANTIIRKDMQGKERMLKAQRY